MCDCSKVNERREDPSSYSTYSLYAKTMHFLRFAAEQPEPAVVLGDDDIFVAPRALLSYAWALTRAARDHGATGDGGADWYAGRFDWYSWRTETLQVTAHALEGSARRPVSLTLTPTLPRTRPRTRTLPAGDRVLEGSARRPVWRLPALPQLQPEWQRMGREPDRRRQAAHTPGGLCGSRAGAVRWAVCVRQGSASDARGAGGALARRLRPVPP